MRKEQLLELFNDWHGLTGSIPYPEELAEEIMELHLVGKAVVSDLFLREMEESNDRVGRTSSDTDNHSYSEA